MIKPCIIVSRCLGFEACRYDGQIKKDKLVSNLKQFVDIITVCPETAIGLPIPRKPIRIEKCEDGLHLIQPLTGNDYTDKMLSYSQDFLENINNIDGFILKSKSPSCGVKDTKIYPKDKNQAITYRDYGMFANKVREYMPYIPLESNNRLKDFNIRNKFLISIFINAWFKDAYLNNDIKKLKEFHLKNKLLIESRSKYGYLMLTKILEQDSESNIIFNNYYNRLMSITNKQPRRNSTIKILFYLLDELNNKIQEKEYDFLENSITKYAKGLVSLDVPLALIQNHAIAHDLKSIYQQSIFNPYPKELEMIS